MRRGSSSLRTASSNDEYCGRGLFPTEADLNLCNKRKAVAAIKKTGPYSSWDELYYTHVDLLTEDFILALRDQFNDIHRNPNILNSPTCFTVICRSVVKKPMGHQTHVVGMLMEFNTRKHKDVKWEEEKRMMNGNMVFLTKTRFQDFSVVGIIQDSSPQLLRLGQMVIKLVKGVDWCGNFSLLPHEREVGKVFQMVESDPFYFPYLHVTNRLQNDMEKERPPLRHFKKEIVWGMAPSDPPAYQAGLTWRQGAAKVKKLLEQFQQELNGSQLVALESVLAHRVALVQGPPGTGKTYLGCKIAEYFVKLKKLFPGMFRGPILVVTTTNHAVDEFLTRCKQFTGKIIHGYGVKHEQADYGDLQKKYDSTKNFKGRVQLFQEADIVAMTTTRASYLRDHLDSLQIKIVIVEEAAEALEGYVLSSVPSGAEHLIQIGDHKQLQPGCAHQLLGVSHHLNLSLFERLIRNGAECPMLNEQRRMRPEISKLVRCIYPTLTDHPCTKERPPADGVDLKVPVFFVSRPEPEQAENKGYINQREARMAAALSRYLLTQGYSAEHITILTTYRKQMHLILKHLKQFGKITKDVRVTTVDSFQGEENQIIILSLVRSNNTGRIGFLKLENRACVALSRARDAFFILGNLPCLVSSGSPVWTHVRDELTRAGQVGPGLPLKCKHGKKSFAQSAEDVMKAINRCDGCQEDQAALRKSLPKQKTGLSQWNVELSAAGEKRNELHIFFDKVAKLLLANIVLIVLIMVMVIVIIIMSLV